MAISNSNEDNRFTMAKNVLDYENPIVFFDISIGGQDVGKLRIELFKKEVPLTTENFRQFCTGEHRKEGKPIGYKGCCFHMIVKDFMIQGGDFINNNGTGVYSIYNEQEFKDENFEIPHNKAGLLSMKNNGPDSNGCQFFITTTACEYLDKMHVVFGRVFDDDMHIVRKIEVSCVV
uniref:Peptidyl-prolyl cis-trans isomerase n=1 Tax=Myxobolus squamalis TaxID=59785 RepID=A0A6B2FY19_MYXSQ